MRLVSALAFLVGAALLYVILVATGLRANQALAFTLFAVLCFPMIALVVKLQRDGHEHDH